MNKKCSKCKEIKSLDKFYKHREAKDGFNGACKYCKKEYQKNYNKDYKLKNKERIKKDRKKYRLVNKSKIKDYREKIVNELSDVYIKGLLVSNSSLLCGDIPQCLIDAKRQELQIKRITRKECDER